MIKFQVQQVGVAIVMSPLDPTAAVNCKAKDTAVKGNCDDGQNRIMSYDLKDAHGRARFDNPRGMSGSPPKPTNK
jgi:hypothetical protein